MEGTTVLRAEMERAYADLNDVNRRVKKIGWFDGIHNTDLTIEEMAAEKRKDREKSVLDSLPKHLRVPSKYSAGFWPTFIFGVLATVHALVLLMQHWSVAFNVWINFQEINVDHVTFPEGFLDVDLVEEEARMSRASSGGDQATQAKPGEPRQVFPDRQIYQLPNTQYPTHARISPAKGRDVLVPLEYFPVLGTMD
jgi:hypothetical protein